jgi:hypothetical protein
MDLMPMGNRSQVDLLKAEMGVAKDWESMGEEPSILGILLALVSWEDGIREVGEPLLR